MFVAIVLLLSWNDAVSFDRGFQFLEVFSGQGNVSKKMHRLGYSVASIDFDYSNKHMDFLNVSGFLLAIYVLMNMAPRGLTLWAPVCGSWGLPCRHTSGRSIINIAGNTCYQFVRDGNLMISRLTLGLLLVTALNLFWLLEQPSQSLLQHHKRYEWFCNRVAWVFQTHFWLMHHGSKSAKRTVFYGNLSTMNHLDKGVLSKKEKELKTKVSTTRSYRDQNGVKRFVGKKEELKSTQSYPERLGDSIHELYVEELRREPRGDLRVNKTPKPGKSQLALFQELELGDVWQDADLLPVFQYLYFSARTRIPAEWKPVMSQFHKDLDPTLNSDLAALWSMDQRCWGGTRRDLRRGTWGLTT